MSEGDSDMLSILEMVNDLFSYYQDPATLYKLPITSVVTAELKCSFL